MHTNNSWSIDDSRNKFQFGCEYGQLIEDGEIVGAVRNPGYRGISSTFWRSLSGVADTRQLHGDGHPELRQGRTQPGDRHRPRVAGVPVLEHRGLRRRGMSDTEFPQTATTRPTSTSWSPRRPPRWSATRCCSPTSRANAPTSSGSTRARSARPARRPAHLDGRPRRGPAPRGGQHPPVRRVRSVDDARLAALLAQLREQRASSPTTRSCSTTPSRPRPSASSADRSPPPTPRSPTSARPGRTATSSGSTRPATRSRGSPTASGSATGSSRRRSISTGASTCAPTRPRRTSTPASTGTTTRSPPRSTGRPARSPRSNATRSACRPASTAPTSHRERWRKLSSCWSYYGAFGLRAHETKQTPLLKMLVEAPPCRLSSTISEDTAHGVAPTSSRPGSSARTRCR
jgi:hypothetical protein